MLPKSINILGMKFKVSTKNLGNADNLPDGQFSGRSKQVWINPKLPKEDQWRAFWHEIMHGAMWRNGLTFTGIPAEMEEMIVETLASVIYESIEQMDEGWHER